MEHELQAAAGLQAQPSTSRPAPLSSKPVPIRITKLAELPAQTLIDERALAEIFSVTTRTIRRMVSRSELPPPVRMAGRSTWLTGRILAHVNTCAAHAASEAEKSAARLAQTLALHRPS